MMNTHIGYKKVFDIGPAPKDFYAEMALYLSLPRVQPTEPKSVASRAKETHRQFLRTETARLAAEYGSVDRTAARDPYEVAFTRFAHSPVGFGFG